MTIEPLIHLLCPRCGDLTAGEPDPESPEYAVEVCDPCAEQMLDGDDDD